MGFIEKIKFFFEKIFKKEKTKMIDAPKEIENQTDEISNEESKKKKEKFINSLKIKLVKKYKDVETRECVGDGLGFKGEMKY